MRLRHSGFSEYRAGAVRDLARVVKPGGRLLISDLAHTEQYEATLRDEGWSRVERSGRHFLIFPPVRVVVGSKPLN